ncbi:MAG: TetR/AcrR family transcriptional regulator [Candidatus Nanohaloarchaea archaeon]
MGGSEQEIMKATYRALCRHGYADLTIEKIAAEYDKGKSLIYYHFDDKDDLVLSFLDYMEDHLEKNYDSSEGEPADRLESLLELALGIENQEEWEFRKAFIELRTQSQHRQDFREKFREIDNMLVSRLEDIMKEAEVQDPELSADIVASVIDGAISRKIYSDDREGLERIKKEISRVIFDCREKN